MSADVVETVVVANAWCNGLAAVRIDAAGVARVNLYADQLEPGGKMDRVLVARLTMSRETLREIAGEVLKESMLKAARDAASVENRHRKLN